MDEIKKNGSSIYYRLVDAYGGEDIMWMELTFNGDELEFNSYTSRFGSDGYPKPHMKFKAKRAHPEIAEDTANES